MILCYYVTIEYSGWLGGIITLQEFEGKKRGKEEKGGKKEEIVFNVTYFPNFGILFRVGPQNCSCSLFTLVYPPTLNPFWREILYKRS